MSTTAQSTFAMRVSLAASFINLVLKVSAYVMTHSNAILGDAAESVVHLAAVAFAAYSLSLVGKPADDNHRYGHGKAEFFSAGFEGLLIVAAAVFTIYESVVHWFKHQAPAEVDSGLLLMVGSVFINGVLGFWLMAQGKREKSLILVSNGKHVLVDCWTSLGAILGLLMVKFTGWPGWDPICGVLMAGNILFSGYGLISRSISGLMDEADPALATQLDEALARETAKRGISFHALRHRDSGRVHWVEVHLVFPGDILLSEAHRKATEIEIAVQTSVEKTVVLTTHLECDGEHHDEHPGGNPAV